MNRTIQIDDAEWAVLPRVATTAQRLAMAKADDESGDRYRRMYAAQIDSAPSPPACRGEETSDNRIDVFNRAARDLPEGWQVTIFLERDSGSIELTDRDGAITDITGDHAETFSDRIDWAVQHAVGLALAAETDNG